MSRETRKLMREKHRVPSSEETLTRRTLIKALILEKGFDFSDLKGLHGELVKAGLDVSDKTLVQDVKLITSIRLEDVRDFNESIVETMLHYIKELKLLIAGERDNSRKGVLIKTLFQCIEKQADIVNRIHSGQILGEQAGRGGGSVVITFGDPPVVGKDGVEHGF